MYKIVWDLSEKRFTDLQRELKSGTYDYCDDYIGGIRVGECGFDLILATDDEYNNYFIIDCYVYSVNENGYAITDCMTPYDERYDGFCYNVNTDEDYETFQRNVNAEIEKYLNDAEKIIKNKAKKETLSWKEM